MHQDEWAPQVPTWTAYTWWQDGKPQYVALSANVCWSLILLSFDPGNERGLAALSNFNAKAVWEQGLAVLTLAHEAVHMSGVWDEGQAECHALAHTDRVLARFGVTTRMEALRQSVQTAHAISPPQYRAIC